MVGRLLVDKYSVPTTRNRIPLGAPVAQVFHQRLGLLLLAWALRLVAPVGFES